MNEVRLAFLAASGEGRAALARPEIADHWEGPSALREFSMAGLAGHMVGSVLRVDEYLQRPVPDDELPVTAPAYYARVVHTDDISDPLHTGIRDRGEQLGALGQVELLDRFDAAVRHVQDRFVDEPPDRLLAVAGGVVMELDQYLRTRILELAVHTDDIYASLGMETPALSGRAMAIATLIDVARIRHGDLAVLRALARRERDEVNALRVL